MQAVEVGGDDRPVLRLHAQRMARAALLQQPDQEDRRLDGHAEHFQGPLERDLHGTAERALEAPHEQLDGVASHPPIVSRSSGTWPARHLISTHAYRNGPGWARHRRCLMLSLGGLHAAPAGRSRRTLLYRKLDTGGPTHSDAA